MSIRRYRMGGAITGTTNAVDSFTAPRAGVLVGIIIAATFTSITASSAITLEVSRAPTSDNGGSSDGAALFTQTLAVVAISNNFVTSGMSGPVVSKFFQCKDKLNLGDPIYLHAIEVGTTVSDASVLLIVEE